MGVFELDGLLYRDEAGLSRRTSIFKAFGVYRLGIVPLIFPRKNFKLWKVVKGIQLAPDFFNDKKDRIKKKMALLRQVLQEF